MDWVRVVVSNYASKLYFGAVFKKGISVIFRNPVKLGEVYDVTLRENGAPAGAKAKFDVVEYRRVPTHEFTNISVREEQVLITCRAEFVTNDDRDKSVKIFQNETFGEIIDLNNKVPNGFHDVDIEFRLTSSPRNKFYTICVVTRFIKGSSIIANLSKQGEVQEESSGLTRKNADKSDSMFASRIRRPKYCRDEYMLDDDEYMLDDATPSESMLGSVQANSSPANGCVVAEEISVFNNTVSSDDWNGYETAVDESQDDDTPVIPTDYARAHKGFVNHFFQTGEAVVWCVNLYRDIVLDAPYSKTVMLGKWYEFDITNDNIPTVIPNSIKRIKDYTPTCMVSGHPELKCELVYDESKQYKFRNKCILISELVGEVVCDVPSICDSLGPGCRLFAWIVRFKCRDRVCWVVSSKSPTSPISSIQINQASSQNDDDSYSHKPPSPYITNEIPEYARHIGFVNHVPSNGESLVVWCLDLHQDIVLDNSHSNSMRLGDWIEFTASNTTPPIIADGTARVIEDFVETRIVDSQPEIKCDLVFDDKLSNHSGEFIFQSAIVGHVLCDIPSVCALVGPGSRLTPWIVRSRCRDEHVRWVVSSNYSASPNDSQKVAKYKDGSFVQNTPSESVDSESLPDSYCSSPTEPSKLTFSEICQFSNEDTVDYLFKKHPSLLCLLERVDEEKYQHLMHLM